MRIFLQRSVPIQPKTSNILPKFAFLRPPTLWLWARLGVRALQRRFGFPEVDAAGPQVLRDGHLGTGKLANLAKLAKILQIFANFWRARSQVYQNESLQENMRLTAFFKLYKICILLHLCNLKFLAKCSKNDLKNQQLS